MKRGYTTAEYREMMHGIREIIPDCAVSSDFIVGFCGESEASFQKSMDAVREYRFKNSFIFKYSPRRGTKAFELYADDVPDDVKKRRNNELLALQSEISEEDNAEFIGQTVQVLVEGPSKKASGGQEAGVRGQESEVGGRRSKVGDQRSEVGDAVHGSQVSTLNSQLSALNAPRSTQLVGRTKCDRIVVFDGNPRLAGTLADVVIHDCTPTTLLGTILTHEVQHASHELLPILG
jgi:tRNA-2-methylthio-N6-dimethylallyladenosine synthase